MTSKTPDITCSDALWADLETLCGFGGRLCGTPSEEQARVFLRQRLEQITDAHEGTVFSQELAYDGWRGGTARIESATDALPATPLVWSPPARDLALHVVDVGRGTPEDFAARASDIPGALVLARHEYMFSTGTIHRSRKFAAALEGGAAAFAMVGPIAEAGVTGGAGFGGLTDIPAIGLSPEHTDRLADGARVHLTVEAAVAPAVTENLFLDLPGQENEWVVLSAHIDGHDLAQSAMDNATGLAAVLEAARILAPAVAGFRRGLRIGLFSLEEWGLVGSERYVDGLGEAERQAIALNLNLDSVAGSPRLAAMSSGFPAIETFLGETAAELGMDLAFHRPLLRNSDHYNFAGAGIPAFRLVAGFEEPKSNLRHVLTRGDTMDKIDRGDLEQATRLVALSAERACAGDRDFRAGGPA